MRFRLVNKDQRPLLQGSDRLHYYIDRYFVTGAKATKLFRPATVSCKEVEFVTCSFERRFIPERLKGLG